MLEVLLESAKSAPNKTDVFTHYRRQKSRFLRQIRKDLKYFANKQNTYFV